MLGRACDDAERYLRDTVSFAARNSGYQALLRGAVKGQSQLALTGRNGALDVLLDAGIAAKTEAVRAPIALGVGLVADALINKLEF